MRRAAIAGALWLATALPVACIDAGRVNRQCRWTDASSGPLDLARAADREHLRQDAQVAWEIGQRYADVRYRTQPRFERPLLEACRRAMFDSIVARHAVTHADVDRATRARQWPVDVIAVFLPMLALAALTALLAAREVERLIGTRSAPAAAQTVLVGLVALIMAGLMQIWAMSVESWRLRNEHIAGRAFVVPSVAHPAIAVAAMVLVVATTLAVRASRRRSSAHSIR
jgi:hypothetical protein